MEASYPTKLVSNEDQIANLLLLTINFCYRSQFREISLGVLKIWTSNSAHTQIFSRTGANVGSNMTSNYLLVWINGSQSVLSVQWYLFDFLHFLQQGLDSLQDQAPRAITFSSGLCSSQRSRKPALKRLWKVELQWHISRYEAMFSYLLSYYCKNWRLDTHFLPSLQADDFIGLTLHYWKWNISYENDNLSDLLNGFALDFHLTVYNGFWFITLSFTNERNRSLFIIAAIYSVYYTQYFLGAKFSLYFLFSFCKLISG